MRSKLATLASEAFHKEVLRTLETVPALTQDVLMNLYVKYMAVTYRTAKYRKNTVRHAMSQQLFEMDCAGILKAEFDIDGDVMIVFAKNTKSPDMYEIKQLEEFREF